MNVLLINSSPKALAAVEQSLKQVQGEIFSVEGYEYTIEEIKKHEPQVAIINWGNDTVDIPALCKKIKRLKLSKYLYIIIISSRDRLKQMQDVLNAGGDDFILRPFGGEEFLLRVIKARKRIMLEDKLMKSKKKLMKLAKEDPITNLSNRRSILDEALKEIGRSVRDMKYISSIMIVINNFQNLADRFGGLAMSSVLVDFADRIVYSCRPYDKIGRYEISEFLIILPNTNVNNARKVAGRILFSFSEKSFHINEEGVDVDVSMGISELDPNDILQVKDKKSDDPLVDDLILDSMIKRSSAAVKKAARKGKNKIES